MKESEPSSAPLPKGDTSFENYLLHCALLLFAQWALIMLDSGIKRNRGKKAAALLLLSQQKILHSGHDTEIYTVLKCAGGDAMDI